MQEGFTTCIYESDSPNAVNLGHRIKEVMEKPFGRVSGPTITLVAGKTPVDLLEFITAAEREKKQVYGVYSYFFPLPARKNG
jgi:hypothetical protein